MTGDEARIVMGLRLPNEIIPIELADDKAALQAAELFVGGHVVELWRGPPKPVILAHPAHNASNGAELADNVLLFWITSDRPGQGR